MRKTSRKQSRTRSTPPTSLFRNTRTGVGNNRDGEGICEAKGVGVVCNLDPNHKGYHHDWFKDEWWV